MKENCRECSRRFRGIRSILFNQIQALLVIKQMLKLDTHLPSKILFGLMKALLKMMKNAFLFILKAFLVLKIFIFLS